MQVLAITAVVQQVVLVAVPKLLAAHHLAYSVNLFLLQDPGALGQGSVQRPAHDCLHLKAVEAFQQRMQVVLALLQLTELLVIVIDSPEMVNLELGLHFFLTVEGYEGHFQLMVTHQVQRIVDLSRYHLAVAVELPLAVVPMSVAVIGTTSRGVPEIVGGVLL